MEKVVQYKSINYKVIKEGENVVIQKEVNGSFVNIEGQELTDFLNFINGRVVSVDVPVDDKKEEIQYNQSNSRCVLCCSWICTWWNIRNRNSDLCICSRTCSWRIYAIQ